MYGKQEYEDVSVNGEELARIIDEIEEDKERQAIRQEQERLRAEELRRQDEAYKQREIDRLKRTVQDQQEQLDRLKQNQYYSSYAPYRSVSDKKNWIVILLWFFYGMFGTYYFYLGRWKKGLLYLYTCVKKNPML